MHRCAPKIVVKYVPYWSLWLQVSVIFDGTNVIKDKVTVEAVVVACEAC